MTTIKKGAAVRLIQPEIAGPVLDRRINPETDEIELLVEFNDGAGETHQRWFDADKLEQLPESTSQFVVNPAVAPEAQS